MARASRGPDLKRHPAIPFPQVIGHRGYKSGFPEYTMAAFRGAVQIGADGIETDLRLSKDGVIVLLHVSGINRRRQMTNYISTPMNELNHVAKLTFV
jgi:glycerophosphoryl diester phosphodiesterase